MWTGSDLRGTHVPGLTGPVVVYPGTGAGLREGGREGGSNCIRSRMGAGLREGGRARGRVRSQDSHLIQALEPPPQETHRPVAGQEVPVGEVPAGIGQQD